VKPKLQLRQVAFRIRKVADDGRKHANVGRQGEGRAPAMPDERLDDPEPPGAWKIDLLCASLDNLPGDKIPAWADRHTLKN
jgi:hypothetical protein